MRALRLVEKAKEAVDKEVRGDKAWISEGVLTDGVRLFLAFRKPWSELPMSKWRFALPPHFFCGRSFFFSF